MTEKINDGGPAFPNTGLQVTWGDDGKQVEEREGLHAGMSLRDYFAAHAPPMDPQWHQDMRADSAMVYREDALADWAYHYADAMLKASGR